MFSRIHDKLGTAGLLIAIVALVAALAGTAIAAVGLNPQQKKEVKKIAKKFAGEQGPPGPAGPAGAKGDTGAPGASGKDGVGVIASNVPKGAGDCSGEGGSKFVTGGVTTFACNGEGAEAEGPQTVLNAGETETGLWSYAAKEVISTFMTISFPLRVEPAPEFNWIGPSKPSTADCPGSYSDPQAAPGELCVYAKEAVSSGEGEDHHPNGLTTGSVGGEWTTDPTSGVVAEFPIESGQEGYGFGSWAVTAEE